MFKIAYKKHGLCEAPSILLWVAPLPPVFVALTLYNSEQWSRTKEFIQGHFF